MSASNVNTPIVNETVNVPPPVKGKGKSKKPVASTNADAANEKPKRAPREITKMSDKNKTCVYFGIWLIGKLKEQGYIYNEENPRDTITNILPILNSEDEAEKGKFFVSLEKDIKKMNTKKAIEKERKDAEKAALKAQKEAAKAAEKEAKAAERAAKAAERAEAKKNNPKPKKTTTKKEKVNQEVDDFATDAPAAAETEAPPTEKKNKRNNKKKTTIASEEDIITELEKRIPTAAEPEPEPEPEPAADQELAEEDIIEENTDDYEEFKFAGLTLMKHKVTNWVLKMNDDEEYEELGLYKPEENHIVDENGDIVLQEEAKKTKKTATKKGAAAAKK